jgi:hypothetical protein
MRHARVIAITQHRAQPDRAASWQIVQDLRRWLRVVATAVTDPYRPERHYMRGPGPKWREKHRK